MFATPAILALLFFVYIRPQEIFPAIGRVPLLYILVALALTGIAVDLKLQYARLTKNPMLTWAVAHLAWNVVSMVIMARHALIVQGIGLTVAFIIYFCLSQGIQTFRSLATAGVTLLGISLFIAGIGLHQAFTPLGCVRPSDENAETLVPIDSPCADHDQCRKEHERDDLFCEHVGLLGTTSIGTRIRYRGLMQDPNELAMVGSMAIPFAFALFELRRSIPRLLVAIMTFLTVATVDVFTKSRSGQLAFLSVLGVYLLRRLRWMGILLAGVLTMPILLLGGRSGSEADESSDLRLGYWAAAIQMARDSPLFGIGHSQFPEQQPQTAHSSIMLALGETGLPGLFFWTGLIYVAFKIPLAVLRQEKTPESRVAQIWATAMLASMAGFSTSALFLSLTDHYILWVLLGLVGALYAATVRHDPRFRVTFGLRDFLAVGALDMAFILVLHFYTRSKGF